MQQMGRTQTWATAVRTPAAGPFYDCVQVLGDYGSQKSEGFHSIVEYSAPGCFQLLDLQSVCRPFWTMPMTVVSSANVV